MTQIFENWVTQRADYTKLVYIHGDRLFLKDGDRYQLLIMQIAYEAFTCKADK